MTLNFVIPELQIGGAGTPPLQFFRKGFVLGGTGSPSPTWRDIILHGSTALTLVNAKADSLQYLKLFGGTEFVPETYLDTVTAEGKCIQSNVPEGYTQVDGVTNSSSGYIDTGIKADVDDIEFDIVAQYNISSGSSWYILQSRAPSSAPIYGISGSTTGNTIIGAFSGTSLSSTITRQLNHIYHINFKCKNGNATLLVEDLTANTSETVTGTYTFTAATTNIGMFSNINGGGTLASGNTDVMSAYIIKSGVKVMDYVSCTDSNSVAGFYDWASASFVGATVGGMTARSATVPTPFTPMNIVCNNGTITTSYSSLTIDSTRILAYIAADNYWTSSGDSYTIRIPVTVGEKYVLEFTSTDSDVVGGIYRYGFTDSETNPAASGSGVRLLLTGVYRGSPQETPLVIVTALAKYLIVQCSSNKMPNNITNGLFLVKKLELSVDGTVETITDSEGNTATCENLLSVGIGNIKDTQEILSGVVTRRFKIAVLDGTENWIEKTVGGGNRYQITIADARQSAYYNLLVTHGTSSSDTSGNVWSLRNGGLLCFYYDSQMFPTITDFTNWLKKQYNAGFPVMIIYPLETEITESVSPQGLSKSPVTATGSVSSLVVNTTESSHTTPSPYQPLDINCNNGVVKVSPNIFNKLTDDTGQGWYLSSGVIANAAANGTIVLDCKPNTKYSFWHTNGSGGCRAFTMNKDTIAIGDTGVWATQSTSITVSANTVCTTYATPSDAKKLYILGYRSDITDRTRADQLGDLMVVEGEVSTATPYMAYGTTYVTGTTETVSIHGRNLSKGALDNIGYTSTGGTSSSSTFCGNLWKIKCTEGEKYTVSFGNFTDGVSGVFINTWKTDGTWNMRQAIAVSGNALTYTIPTGIAEANFTLYKTGGITIGDNSWLQVEKGDTATTYEPYYNGGTATAQPLYKIGDYQDIQSVLDGQVSRKVGIKVFDGTEQFVETSETSVFRDNASISSPASATYICSHYKSVPASTSIGAMENYTIKSHSVLDRMIYIKNTNYTTASGFKAWLKDKFDEGNPVIMLYPLATATTETVTAQPLTIQAGTNIVEITQASMDNLELEVKYKAGVTVTIEEVEDAQLSNDVTVIIS